jgi:hypothetical protein
MCFPLNGVKWVPAISFAATARKLEAHVFFNQGESSWDYSLLATKIIPDILPRPLYLHAGIRSSKARWSGFRGFSGERDNCLTEWVVAFMITNKIIVGMEFKQQPHGDKFYTYCYRHYITPKVLLDIGLGDLGPGYHSQWAACLNYYF